MSEKITAVATRNQEIANPLGMYLKDRRSRLDPAAFDLPRGRRRTPGLRREEVAQRAHVSVTWYTWLEQGRGGAPSADMLDRIARALLLEETEREHLYLLAQGRPPEVKSSAPVAEVSPRMQGVLDALENSPALIKDAAWNILAWNEAAAAALIDYASLPLRERNVLRLIFCHPRLRAEMPDWEQTARFTVATFRAELARTGTSRQAQSLIDAMHRASPEFAAIWRDHDVRLHGEGTKRIQPAVGGPITLEYTSFAVDGHAGLSMVIYMPATSSDAGRIKALVRRRRLLREETKLAG